MLQQNRGDKVVSERGVVLHLGHVVVPNDFIHYGGPQEPLTVYQKTGISDCNLQILLHLQQFSEMLWSNSLIAPPPSER